MGNCFVLLYPCCPLFAFHSKWTIQYCDRDHSGLDFHNGRDLTVVALHKYTVNVIIYTYTVKITIQGILCV